MMSQHWYCNIIFTFKNYFKLKKQFDSTKRANVIRYITKYEFY